MKHLTAALCAIALSLAGTALAAERAQSHAPIRVAYEIAQYYVYCVEDETRVEAWDLEQMKIRTGRDVCLLYTDTSISDAQNWMDKNFPTHACFCDY